MEGARITTPASTGTDTQTGQTQARTDAKYTNFSREGIRERIVIKRKRRIKSRNYPGLGKPSHRPFSEHMHLEEKPYDLKFRLEEEKVYQELSNRLYPTYFCSMRELGILNPFNTDATEVRINLDTVNKVLVIEDNGSGMDRKAIFNKFLIIDNQEERRNSRTGLNNRPVLGQNGISRLSWQKLGRYARIITETETEAHEIEMHEYDVHVKVTRTARRGRTGTKWIISGLYAALNESDIVEFLNAKASILISIHHNFEIYFNEKKIRPYRIDGDRIRLSGDNFKAEISLGGADRKLKVTCNHFVVDEIGLSGLGGYVESTRFNLTPNRDSLLRDETYISIISELRGIVLNELLKISFLNPGILKKYRENFIGFASSSLNGSAFQRMKLAREIPVRVYGQGWLKLGELKGENIFVEVSPDGNPSPKAERAAELNFPIVIAHSETEMLLVKSVTGASDIKQLPGDLLDSKGRTISAEGKYRDLLEGAAEVVGLMTSVNLAIMPEDEMQGMGAEEIPNTEPIMVEFKTSRTDRSLIQTEFIEDHSEIDTDPGERPRYIIAKNEGDSLEINGINIALCEMDRYDINALANPSTREIFININSVVIQKIFSQERKVQKVMLMEEISHELAHLLGYGLVVHDTPFFKIQRMLKYIAMQAM